MNMVHELVRDCPLIVAGAVLDILVWDLIYNLLCFPPIFTKRFLFQDTLQLCKYELHTVKGIRYEGKIITTRNSEYSWNKSLNGGSLWYDK